MPSKRQSILEKERAIEQICINCSCATANTDTLLKNYGSKSTHNRNEMKQNQTWTQETPHFVSTPSLMSSTSVEELLNHWAWKFHTYFFAALYIVFAVNCLIAFVRQSSRSVNKSVYRRFTTMQLFVAAVVKAAVLLWCPFLEREISKAR